MGLRAEKWTCYSGTQERPVPAPLRPPRPAQSPSMPPLCSGYKGSPHLPPPMGSSAQGLASSGTPRGGSQGREAASSLAPEAANNQLITAPLCGNNGAPKSSAGQREEVSGQ